MKKRSYFALLLIITMLLSACTNTLGNISDSGSENGNTSALSSADSLNGNNSILESIFESFTEQSSTEHSFTEHSSTEHSSDSSSETNESSKAESSKAESSKAESKSESSKAESKSNTSKSESSKSESSKVESSKPEVSKPSLPKANPKVAYIPLDDRPVNVDRVIYQAASGGIELLIPNADLYATKLDGRGTNSNGTQYGNREELIKWLKSVDDECDYFVISLDQLLSGGLVGSRAMNSENLAFEYAVMDYLSELAVNNKLYVFDTVMRLASTVGYNGYTMDEYNALRAYGKIARKQLTGSSLNVQNIISGYDIGTNGGTISTKLSDIVVNNYLRARARKLKLVDYMLNKYQKSDNIYFFVGIDDSSPEITIQTNEINYIKEKLSTKGVIYAGTDELGMMGIARLGAEHYDKRLKVAVRYFGDGANSPADSFDIGTLESNIKSHLESLNAIIINSGTPDLEILVLTRQNGSEHYSNASSLIDRAKSNIKNKIPTAIIDASGNGGVLSIKMIETLELSMLVGYSSWNTVGNSIGIALGQSFSRVCYLKSGNTVTEKSNDGFLKSMTFAYIKDISYIIGMNRNYNFSSLSYYLANQSKVNEGLKSAILSSRGEYSAASILDNLNSGSFITGLATYKTSKVGKLLLDKFKLPWFRTFEMTFQIQRSVA